MKEAELVPLDDGRVFVVGGSVPQEGGEDGSWRNVLTTRIFDPVRNDWLVGADLPGEMTVSAALQLPDGSVLLVGQFGETWTDPPLTAIRYDLDSFGVASANGADQVKGDGLRGRVAFEFHAVLTPSAKVVGRFDSTLMSNVGVLFQGDVDCGWVSGNIGVFGGLMDGADPASPNGHFTIMVSDGPDGIIIGNGRPQCGTGGYGDPRTLTISSGEIVVIDR